MIVCAERGCCLRSKSKSIHKPNSWSSPGLERERLGRALRFTTFFGNFGDQSEWKQQICEVWRNCNTNVLRKQRKM